MWSPCGLGKSPKSFSAAADGGQLRVNVDSAFGPSRLSAPALLWTLDQLSLYQMEAWGYSALATGHSVSVYMSVCDVCAQTHTCVFVASPFHSFNLPLLSSLFTQLWLNCQRSHKGGFPFPVAHKRTRLPFIHVTLFPLYLSVLPF